MKAISFSPKEAAALTGVSPVQQRDWRRHGFLPSAGDGWTEYDAAGLARLYLIKAVSTMGPVAQGSLVADALAAPLGRYIEAVANGGTSGPPTDCAVILGGGRVGVFKTIQEAVDAADAERMPTIQLVPLQSLSTPLAIRVRAHFEALS